MISYLPTSLPVQVKQAVVGLSVRPLVSILSFEPTEVWTGVFLHAYVIHSFMFVHTQNRVVGHYFLLSKICTDYTNNNY